MAPNSCGRSRSHTAYHPTPSDAMTNMTMTATLSCRAHKYLLHTPVRSL